MSIYQRAERPRPDDDFEPGALRHLTPGVRGRLLDPRRTPVSVAAVRVATGFVDIRIEVNTVFLEAEAELLACVDDGWP